MTPAAPHIDEALVGRLLADQFPDLAALPIQRVRPGGWNNYTFRVGETLLARLPKAAAYANQLVREQRWLPILGAAGLPTPISRPQSGGQPACGFPHPWSIYDWVPGSPLADKDLRASETLAAQLAAFLRALHRVPPRADAAAGPDNFHRGGDLAAYDEQMRRALPALPTCLQEPVTRIWEVALASRWTRQPVWIHGDFAPRNLLVDDRGHLCGVIDFGQVGVGDPACDLVILWVHLAGEARRRFRQDMGLDAETWERARGWAAWKAAILASGVSGGPRPDNDAAETVLRELIGVR